MPRKSAALTAAAKAGARAKAAPAKASKATSKTAARPALTAKPAGKAAAKTAPRSAPKSGKASVKGAVKAAAKALAVPAKVAPIRKAPPAAREPAASARPVLVRDSFTMPEQEYAVLADVKGACLRAGVEVKKSELLRVAVALLGQVDIATLKAVLAALPQLKTGRPPAA